MGYSSAVTYILSAKSNHICSWCNERIDVGEPYQRWRWYSDGDAMTCKMHSECHLAMLKRSLAEGEAIEFTPGDNPRGCDCGFAKGCEICAERNQK